MKWIKYLLVAVILVWGWGDSRDSQPGVGIVETKINVAQSEIPLTKLVINYQGQQIEVDNYETNAVYQPGDKVLLDDTGYGYAILGKFRTRELRILFALFLATVILVSGSSGMTSIGGLALSFFIIFKYTLPEIAGGANPLIVTLISCLGIVGIGFYITHGLSMKTSIAVFSSIATLAVIVLLANIFGRITGLTGFGTEEVSFLTAQLGEKLQVYYLLMAGIIIGALGVLDDVTISQVSVVEEVYKANKKMRFWELFNSAMNVGHDHIASMVNTLVLVYAGVSLPLLLLFVGSQESWTTLVNFEPVTEEIVRTLVSSIGLIMSVPIATLTAAYWYKNYN